MLFKNNTRSVVYIDILLKILKLYYLLFKSMSETQDPIGYISLPKIKSPITTRYL